MGSGRIYYLRLSGNCYQLIRTENVNSAPGFGNMGLCQEEDNEADESKPE
jgi:hypothetical protein